jgi:hypothetical protein
MTEQDRKDIEFRAKGVQWAGELSVTRWLGPDGMVQALRDRQTLLDQLRLFDPYAAALVRTEELRESIRTEMQAKALDGILWSNGQCAAWPDYEQAVRALATAKLDLVKRLRGKPCSS